MAQFSLSFYNRITVLTQQEIIEDLSIVLPTLAMAYLFSFLETAPMKEMVTEARSTTISNMQRATTSFFFRSIPTNSVLLNENVKISAECLSAFLGKGSGNIH